MHENRTLFARTGARKSLARTILLECLSRRIPFEAMKIKDHQWSHILLHSYEQMCESIRPTERSITDIYPVPSPFSSNFVPTCFHSAFARIDQIAMLAYTYSLPSTGVRALICRFQLVCARWGISPACIVMLLSMGVRALGCITCLHCVTAFHWRACVEAYRLLASTSAFH